MDYRFKEKKHIISFPEDPQEENRGIKDCCSPILVLASSTSQELEKNDLTDVFVKFYSLSDSVSFRIRKCPEDTDLPLLGEELVCPQDSLVEGFIFDWRQYLLAYGIGKYRIFIDYTISGVSKSYLYRTFELKEYSINTAKNTVRFYSMYSSKNERLNIDFSNSNHKGTIRFDGYFGDIQPKTEEKKLINKGRVSDKVKREDLYEYSFESNLLSYVITSKIQEALLNQDNMYIMDHNPTNHVYFKKQVNVDITTGAEYTYFAGSRKARISVKFGDKEKTRRTYYNKQ